MAFVNDMEQMASRIIQLESVTKTELLDVLRQMIRQKHEFVAGIKLEIARIKNRIDIIITCTAREQRFESKSIQQ